MGSCHFEKRGEYICGPFKSGRNLTERAENITLCSGLGRCNLAFWLEREVFEQVGDVSEGDILWIEGDYSGSSFNDLSSVYVSRIIEHIKK